MNIIQKSKELEGSQYYKLHLHVINGFLHSLLTDIEIDVLATFMSLPLDVSRGDVFNTYARKVAREKLNMSASSISNHLRSLQEKKYIMKEELSNRLYIVSYLLPSKDVQGYQFRIIKKETNEVE